MRLYDTHWLHWRCAYAYGVFYSHSFLHPETQVIQSYRGHPVTPQASIASERSCIVCGSGVVVTKPIPSSLQWRHNGRDGVSNQRPHDCLLNRLFGRRSKKTSKLRVTGLCAGNSPVAGEFPAQMVSNAENVSIWCRHQVLTTYSILSKHKLATEHHANIWYYSYHLLPF